MKTDSKKVEGQCVIPVVGVQSEQLTQKQECYKTGKTCEYSCSGLCKESC